MATTAMKCVQLTVYYGQYKSAKSNGAKWWCKCVMHAAPVVNGKINSMFDMPIPYWLPDSAAESMITLARAKGEKLSTGKTEAYKLVGDSIPTELENCFTDLMDLRSVRVDLGGSHVRIDGNKKPVVKNGKPVVANHVSVTFWEGGLSDQFESLGLGFEARKERYLSEWLPLDQISLNDDESDTPEKEEKTNETNNTDTNEAGDN